MEHQQDLHAFHFCCPNHSGSILNGLNRLRNREIFHDVVLKCNGIEISAHRLVLASSTTYFDAMFTGHLIESQSPSVEIQEVDAIELQHLIEFIYTGEIVIHRSNVQSVLQAANLIQLDSVKEACCQYLHTKMNLDNCLGILRLAVMFNCPKLSTAARKLLNEHFSEIIRNDDQFLDLAPAELRELLSSDQLTVHEDEIFEAFVRWVSHDLENRGEIADQLCDVIRFTSLSRMKIHHLSNSEDFLERHAWCKDHLIRAMSFHLLSDDEQLQSKPEEQTGSNQKVLMIIGGEIDNKRVTSMYGMDFGLLNGTTIEYTKLQLTGTSGLLHTATGGNLEDESDIIQTFADLPIPRSAFGVAFVDNLIYVIGGYTSDGVMSSMDIYYPGLNTWVPGPPMTGRRAEFGVAVLCEHIYVLGGRIEQGRKNENEVYNIENGQWDRLVPMRHYRSRLRGAVLGGKVYTIGGYYWNPLSCVERYDPTTDTWSTMPDLICKRDGPSVCTLNDRLYAVGGEGSAAGTAEFYSLTSDNWEPIANLNIPRKYPDLLPHNNYLFVIGGSQEHARDSIERYDPSSDLWEPLPMKLPSKRIRSGVLLFQSEFLDFR